MGNKSHRYQQTCYSKERCQSSIWIFFNRRDDSGNCLYGDKVKVEFKGDEWLHHPDENVDLSILPVGPKLKKLGKNGENLFLSNDLYEIVPSNEDEWSRVGPLEDIVSIGYPNGLWDEHSNSPICRKGITATFPKLNYHNKEEFVVDMPIYPGISGSPVYAYSFGMEYYEGGGWGQGSKCLLIGILYGGLKYKIGRQGADLYLIPTTEDTAHVHEYLSNLGVAIKSSRLKDFENVLEHTLDDDDKEWMRKGESYTNRNNPCKNNGPSSTANKLL